MLEIETTPTPGQLPAPVPPVAAGPVQPEPGETVPGPVRHYRHKGRGAPQCGADPDDDGVYARTWNDVTCPDCVAARKPAGRRKDEGQPKQTKEDQPAAMPEGLAVTGPEVIKLALLTVIKAMRRRPPPLVPVDHFSRSASACLVYYDLIPETEEVHPLVPLVFSGYLLYSAMSEAEAIEDDDELEKAWADG